MSRTRQNPLHAASPTAGLRIPSIDRLLRHALAADAIARHGRALVLDCLREVTASVRAAQESGTVLAGAFDEAALLRQALSHAEALSASSLRPVLNLSGTVLHTNLGRALLPESAIDAVTKVMRHACTLEYALDEGQRGERDSHVEALVCRLTGAEAATVVNNNAAAVLLCLSALAAGREVVVSRGELVEIGGAFRIPDVMQAAGCTLREVGTTNRTHLRDYADAIGESTAAVMKVHASNYAIVGFTHAVAEQELAELAKSRGLPLITDLGSGSLIDMQALGLPPEPTVAAALAQGADIVSFSGDKLLGGPQCGFIVGRADLVNRIRRHPLKRALRLDKMTLAALQAVLALYLDPDTLTQRLPTLRLLTRPSEDIRRQGEQLLPHAQQLLAPWATVALCDCESQIGSGSLPVDRLLSAALRLVPVPGMTARALAARLRECPVPVIGRLHGDAVWLDLRCLDDAPLLLAQFGTMAAGSEPA